MSPADAYVSSVLLGAILIGWVSRRAYFWFGLPFTFIWYIGLTLFYYR